MTDVFISYAREDRDRVRPIAEALTARGLDVWWDPDIRPGREFREEIAVALDTAKAMIVVWSQHSTVSRFVRDEADEGAKRQILFPVLLDLVDIPYGFRQIQTVDLAGWRGRQSFPAFTALVDAITDFVGADESADATRPADRSAKTRRSLTRFFITGAVARLRLLLRALLLSLIVAVIALGLWTYVAATSFRVREALFGSRAPTIGLIGMYKDENFLIGAVIAVVAAFCVALFARLITFWSDGVFGAKSLSLFSRSVAMITMIGLLASAPVVLESGYSVFAPNVTDVELARDGRYLLTALSDRTAVVWDLKSPDRPRAVLKGHDRAVRRAEFNPRRNRIVTVSDDGTARVWTRFGKLLKVLREPVEETGSSKRVVGFWQAVSSGFWIPALSDRIVQATFSPDGALLATATRSGIARVWDVESLRPVTKGLAHDRLIHSVSFSPDSQELVTASNDHTARVWDAHSGASLLILKHPSAVESAVFSPDGKQILTTSADKAARIWAADTGDLLRTFESDQRFDSASFSPDGTRVATVSHEYRFRPAVKRVETLRVWDIATRQLAVNRIAEGSDSRAEFSPDEAGRWILTSTSRGGRLLNASTGAQIAEFKNDNSYASTPAHFDADGKHVTVGYGDGTTFIWNTPSDRTPRIFTASATPLANWWRTETAPELPYLAPLGCKPPKCNKDSDRDLVERLTIRGIAVAIAAILLAALCRAIARLVIKPNLVQWVPVSVTACILLYVGVVYAAHFPAEALGLWSIVGLVLIPVVALARLILALIARPAFTGER